MTGTILKTDQRPGATPMPEPTQTTLDDVMQTITVTNPASFNGNAKAVDFRTSETDNQTAPVTQTFSETVDQYFAFSNTYYNGNFTNLGYVSKDDSGYGVTYKTGSGNGLADKLPEITGDSWTNGAAASISTATSDGQSSSATIASNGSYTQTVTYQNVNPQGATTSTSTVSSNLDGSGSYVTPRRGSQTNANYNYSVAAPTADGSGTITATTMIPGASGSTAAPTVSSTTVPNWIPTGFIGKALATEGDVDDGPKAFPAACKLPASFGTSGNAIVTTKKRVDPMFGEFETSVSTSYVVANVGPACVTILDTQNNYYDFTGQNGVGYFSGTPQQITVLNETLYLTSEQLMSAARKPLLRSQIARKFAIRVTTAQSRLQIARLKQRSQLLRAFLVPARGHGNAFSINRGIH